MNGRDSRDSPPWVWAMLVALALVTLTAGAIVGMVTTDERGTSAARSDGETAQAGGPPPLTVPSITESLPPTVPIPPITDVPADTGLTGTLPGITDTIPPTTTVPVTGSWPAGRSGWTVILASVAEAQGRADADAIAARASAAGLPSVGVLRSSDYSSLRAGFWVVYTGVYDTQAQARAALPRAQAAGFASAYPRRVAA